MSLEFPPCDICDKPADWKLKDVNIFVCEKDTRRLIKIIEKLGNKTKQLDLIHIKSMEQYRNDTIQA